LLNQREKSCRSRRKYPDNLRRMPAALTCKKNINDCPETALKFVVYERAIIYIFFAAVNPLQPGGKMITPKPDCSRDLKK